MKKWFWAILLTAFGGLILYFLLRETPLTAEQQALLQPPQYPPPTPLPPITAERSAFIAAANNAADEANKNAEAAWNTAKTSTLGAKSAAASLAKSAYQAAVAARNAAMAVISAPTQQEVSRLTAIAQNAAREALFARDRIADIVRGERADASGLPRLATLAERQSPDAPVGLAPGGSFGTSVFAAGGAPAGFQILSQMLPAGGSLLSAQSQMDNAFKIRSSTLVEQIRYHQEGQTTHPSFLMPLKRLADVSRAPRNQSLSYDIEIDTWDSFYFLSDFLYSILLATHTKGSPGTGVGTADRMVKFFRYHNWRFDPQGEVLLTILHQYDQNLCRPVAISQHGSSYDPVAVRNNRELGYQFLDVGTLAEMKNGQFRVADGQTFPGFTVDDPDQTLVRACELYFSDADARRVVDEWWGNQTGNPEDEQQRDALLQLLLERSARATQARNYLMTNINALETLFEYTVPRMTNLLFALSINPQAQQQVNDSLNQVLLQGAALTTMITLAASGAMTVPVFGWIGAGLAAVVAAVKMILGAAGEQENNILKRRAMCNTINSLAVAMGFKPDLQFLSGFKFDTLRYTDNTWNGIQVSEPAWFNFMRSCGWTEWVIPQLPFFTTNIDYDMIAGVRPAHNCIQFLRPHMGRIDIATNMPVDLTVNWEMICKGSELLILPQEVNLNIALKAK